MNSLTSWLHRPFMPLDRRRDAKLPYIGRLSTDTGSITIQWCDHGSDGPHTLICQGGNIGAKPTFAEECPDFNLDVVAQEKQKKAQKKKL